MLVSGGQILAIDKVNTGNTILGDGVQKPLDVNTDLIATTSSVSSVSSVLEQQIDSVSSNFKNYYTKEETSGAQQIQDAFDNFKTTQTIVSAGSDIVDVASAKLDEKTVVYTIKVTPGEVNIVCTSGISAKQTDNTWTIGLSADFLSANALEDYYKKTETSAAKEISAALTALSSWADETFLKEHQSLEDYYKKSETSGADEISNALLLKQDVSAMSAYATSAWVDENYQKKGDYVTSANDSLAGEQLVLKDNEWQVLEETDWTDKIAAASAAAVTSAKNYTDTKLEDYYKQNETSSREELEDEFAKYQLKGDYLSANALDEVSGAWNSVVDTVSSYSGYWNEVSAYSATSGQFVTSALEDFTAGLANVLVKDDENNVTWSGVDLSKLGKIYGMSSQTPDLLTVGISADEETQEPIYVLSAAKPSEVSVPGIAGYGLSAWKDTTDNTYKVDVQLSGISGVSAEYDSQTNQWLISVQGGPAYANYQAITSPDAGAFVPTYYSQLYNVGNGITLTNNKLYVAPGLWHVTIYARITNDSLSNEYYDATVECNSVKNVVQFDNSYQHSEYVNLDVDINNDSTGDRQLDITVSNVPSDATVVIEQLQIHKVVTGNVAHEGGSTYLPGDGITIDNYQINVNAGSGLAINDNTNKLDVQAGSGIYIDQNNKLSVKLGKGLAFSADGDIVAIETNSDVNAVVETVETLKKELNDKLTTNMNVSDAKSTNNVAPPIPDNGENPSWGASFFTVPLQHNLNELSTISIITSDGINDAAVYPMIIGLLEYNFDFLDPNVPDSTAAGYPADYSRYDSSKQGSYWRSRTTWIADTGLITSDRVDFEGAIPLTAAGKHSYRLKKQVQPEAISVMHDGVEYVNEVGPTLRSDRGYYLIVFGRKAAGITRIMSDDGYTENTNSDPIITYGSKNVDWWPTPAGPAQAMTNWSSSTWQTHIQNDDISFSGISYWKRDVPEAKGLGRPYAMIRNSMR